MEEVLVPIALFTMIGAIAGMSMFFRFRARQEAQLTLRTAMEHGESMSPEVVSRLAEQLQSAGSDLRRGVIAIAIGIAIFIFAQVVGEEDVVRPLMGISAFPFTIGAAYLGLWFANRKPADAQGAA
ncbi:MAG: DUF6249 domain-containing protein [Pseudomonadaceae bacterium]|nr:DUF6249 domain-containing protein [Pseudomonadaceae bacterium]